MDNKIFYSYGNKVFDITDDEATKVNYDLLNGEKFTEILRLGLTLNTDLIIWLQKRIIE